MTTITPGDGDLRHGTQNGYSNLGCRCVPCRRAWADAQQLMRAERTRRLLEEGSGAEHGLASTYGNWGCRCWDCRDAWAEAERRRAKARREGRSRGRGNVAEGDDVVDRRLSY